jgi:hypothetical protein
MSGVLDTAYGSIPLSGPNSWYLQIWSTFEDENRLVSDKNLGDPSFTACHSRVCGWRIRAGVVGA